MADEHRCVCCAVLRQGDPRVYDRANVCEGCRSRLRTLLAEVLEHHGHLHYQLIPTGGTGQRVTGSREAPLPLRVEPLDLLMPARTVTVHDQYGDQTGHASVATILDTWARDWRDTRGMDEYLPPPTVALVPWLSNRVDWACDAHPAVDEFAHEIAELVRVLRRVVGVAEVRVDPRSCDGVPCRGCDLLTLARLVDGSGEIECQNPDCRLVYRAKEYATWVALCAAPLKRERTAVL